MDKITMDIARIAGQLGREVGERHRREAEEKERLRREQGLPPKTDARPVQPRTPEK